MQLHLFFRQCGVASNNFGSNCSAASGFGHAFAKRALQENMKLVLADLNYDALVLKSKELDVSPDRVRFVKCDVSKSDDIQNLSDTAFDSFGGVHLLFNNAGVAHAQLSWEHTEDGESKSRVMAGRGGGGRRAN